MLEKRVLLSFTPPHLAAYLGFHPKEYKTKTRESEPPSVHVGKSRTIHTSQHPEDYHVPARP